MRSCIWRDTQTINKGCVQIQPRFQWQLKSCYVTTRPFKRCRVALEELLKQTRSFALDGEVVRTQFHRVGVTAMPAKLIRS
jgi:hypothetical protein